MTDQTLEHSGAAREAYLLHAEGERLLAAGSYADGFRLCHDAYRSGALRPVLDVPIPHWSGEAVSGRRILIAGEQGFGDQIMFARFAKLLQAQGADIIWLCNWPLARLLTQCAGITATSLDGGRTFEGVSFFCPMTALPLHFFPPLTEPPSAPYLTPPPPVRASGYTIGVQATGNPKHARDAHRSMPPESAAELLSIPGVLNLDHRETGAKDLYDTACVISGLDLVITVDTAVAHLAGAMGTPVWVLLSAAWCDWRWMRQPASSPWYPSARLFRQRYPGDWSAVVADVKGALFEHFQGVENLTAGRAVVRDRTAGVGP